MNYVDIINSITTIGFPAVICLICMWYINKQDERHANEIKEMRTTIENNTLAVTKLCEKLGDE